MQLDLNAPNYELVRWIPIGYINIRRYHKIMFLFRGPAGTRDLTCSVGSLLFSGKLPHFGWVQDSGSRVFAYELCEQPKATRDPANTDVFFMLENLGIVGTGKADASDVFGTCITRSTVNHAAHCTCQSRAFLIPVAAT